MKMVLRKHSAWLTALVLCMLMAAPALAASGANFQVSPILPENQRLGVKGYFDLLVEPGTGTGSADTSYESDSEEIVVEVEVVTASTNLNGIVNYTTPEKTTTPLLILCRN